MQARYLKDILKSNFAYGYSENRYGIPDPLSITTNIVVPFMSSTMKVFIDNQEITSGMYGSGMFTMGDIDIGFVDHIEIYSNNPSYEYSTESALMIIKLYSKKASKDEGGKVELNVGSFADSRVSGYYSQELEDFSYFAYVSHLDDKRQEYDNFNANLSRDKKVNHLFGSFYNDNNRVLVEAIQQDRDAFINESLTATPQESRADVNSLHVGYDSSIENFSFLLSYDYLSLDSKFIDGVSITSELPSSLETKSNSSLYNAEMKHKYKNDNNRLIAGLKYRLKMSKYDDLNVNGIKTPTAADKQQSIYNAFVENQYSVNNNSIFTLGVQYSYVGNKNSTQNDNLYMYRLGYTYLQSDWIFKTVISHTESSLDQYLVDSFDVFITPGDKEKQKFTYIFEDIVKEKDKNRYELILGYMKIEDYLMESQSSLFLLDNYDKDVFILSALARWTLEYNRFDKLLVSLNYQALDHMPMNNYIKSYNGVIRNLNTYKKFDIFNEVVIYQNNIKNRAYYDYSLGAIYHYTKDFTLSIKGENLFNSAKEKSYVSINPATFQEESLNYSYVDRKITFSLAYLF